MTRDTFVDTNVIVYSINAHDSIRHSAAVELLEELAAKERGVVSVQVLQELYSVATRKLTPPLSRAEARILVAGYAPWVVVAHDAETILHASALEDESGISFWDALIVAAAQRSAAKRLFSEDLQHGRRFGALEVVNPFRNL